MSYRSISLGKKIQWLKREKTLNDIDYDERKIIVDHQLVRERGGKYYVERCKTNNGIRYIYMDDETTQSMKNMIANRPSAKVEMIVDGYSGFILLDKNERPKVALHIENECRWVMKKFEKLHPDILLPHVYRHTFCTNMHYSGLDPKSLQYFMGHSEARTTMNIYTHAGFEQAKKEITKVLKFKEQILLTSKYYKNIMI